jgi:hypothetical protein
MEQPEFDEVTVALSHKIMGRILPFCEGGKVKEWKGHLRRGTSWETRQSEAHSAEKELQRIVTESFSFGIWTAARLEEFLAALEGGALLEKPLEIGGSFGELSCSECGLRLRLAFDGHGFVVLSAPCPHPDGLVTEWELNVPSGKILVANDLRGWFPIDEDHNVNAAIGCHFTTLAYAKIGMAHGFVGNTSPEVYRTSSGFVIGNYSDEIWDDAAEDYVENPTPCPWDESVASVCTDLWWYSIADYDELVRRFLHYTPEESLEEFLKERTIHVVDVKPGVYKFRQEQNIDRDAEIVEHATFEWVRDPDPVRDYLKEEDEKHLNATEVLIEHCLSWPTLYMGMSSLDGRDKDHDHVLGLWKGMSPEKKAQSLARAADQIMCVLGGGVEWHENGFPRTTVSDEVKQLAAEYGDVLPFNFETHWYPISGGYGGLCLAAGVRAEYMESTPPLLSLAPSFVLLGLNICQNAIKFGEAPRLNTDVWPPAYEIPFCRERMQLFEQCYRGLRERYPDIVFDAEFDLWMRETDFDKYVADFDFGPERPPKSKWGKPPSTIKKGDHFEFDASVLDDGHFCWAKGCWARKEDAERYVIGVLSGTQSAMGHLHVDARARPPSMIPLKAVGRVLRGTGEGHSSAHLVVTFDYGTENMRGEMAFDARDMPAVRQFSDEQEYQALVERYKTEFDAEVQ